MPGPIAPAPPSPQRLAQHDHALEKAVEAMLRHDDRVRGLDVRARFSGGAVHLRRRWWGHIHAVADPTPVRLIDVQPAQGSCTRRGAPRWRPLHAPCDGVSVFADLAPMPTDAPELDATELARFFD